MSARRRLLLATAIPVALSTGTPLRRDCARHGRVDVGDHERGPAVVR
jgi:hypothetical protein